MTSEPVRLVVVAHSRRTRCCVAPATRPRLERAEAVLDSKNFGVTDASRLTVDMNALCAGSPLRQIDE